MAEGGGTSEHLHWVLCNRCCVLMFSGKSPNPTKMMISSCRCIYCIDCSIKSTENGCKGCGKPHVKLFPIGKNLPQDIMEMFNNSDTSLLKLEKRMVFQNGHYQRNTKMLDKIATHHVSRMRKEKDAERKKILMDINEIEKRSRSKKEKMAKLENDLMRLKAIAKSKNVNPQPLKKDKSSREKQTKNPSTSNYLVPGGVTSPPIYNTHKKNHSTNSSLPWGHGLSENYFK